MKDSHGIKKLYEGAGRKYRGGGRICHLNVGKNFMHLIILRPASITDTK